MSTSEVLVYLNNYITRITRYIREQKARRFLCKLFNLSNRLNTTNLFTPGLQTIGKKERSLHFPGEVIEIVYKLISLPALLHPIYMCNLQIIPYLLSCGVQ